MRMSRLLTFIFVLFTGSALAQQTPNTTLPDNHPIHIVFSVEGVVASGDEGEVLPLTVIERLMQQKALTMLDMSQTMSSQRTLKYSAKMIFRNMNELRAWYTSEETKRLLKELETRSNGRVEVAFQVRRGTQEAALR